MSQEKKPVHIALLGDSTIHNDSYVPEGHTVMDYVWAAFEKQAHVTRYARDGAVMTSIPEQVKRVDWVNTTHMVLSICGNDLLGIRHGVYSTKVDDIETALHYIGSVVSHFDEAYGTLVFELQKLCDMHEVELAICTVYKGSAYNPADQKLNEIAVSMFNDRIRAIAWDLDVALIDLNTLFSDPGDFANPIEPSAQGGWKFAHAVLDFVHYTYPEDAPQTRAVFAGYLGVPKHMEFPVLPYQQAHGTIDWGEENYGTATEPLRSETDQKDDEWLDALQDPQSEGPRDEDELLLDQPVNGDPIYGWGGPPVEDAELHPHVEESWKHGGH